MDGDNRPDKRRLREVRDAVIARLTESFARDEVGIHSFEERIEQAYRAESQEELTALLRDLDAAPIVLAEASATSAELAAEAVTVAHGPPRDRRLGRAILGSVERTGRLPIGTNAVAEAYLGSLVIDLRDATLRPGVTELHVRAVLGSVEIFVPADISVECEGASILGSFEGKTRVLPADGAERPVLRIVGTAVLGSIEIRMRVPSQVEREVKRLRAARALPR